MDGNALKPIFQRMINRISQRNTFYGNKVSPTIMRMFIIESRQHGGGVLVPPWISVLQEGRGPRKGTKDSGLRFTIYKWMQKKGMFRSSTPQGKVNEARFMAMYINKYGNAHFRSKRFIDIYDSEVKKTIEEIDREYSLAIDKITSDII